MGRVGGSVDEAVLAELRAIRAEIQQLARRVGESATRQDLHSYLPVDAFRAHERQHERAAQGWRFWGPFVLSSCSMLVVLMQAVGIHLAAH